MRTISKIIRQVCGAILVEFAEERNPCPEKPDEWKNSANQGLYFITLMDLVDANYTFIWAKLGSNGSVVDAEVFMNI
ncbi:hypothetical protein DPMN_126145 [Dreissena polymorpha]|uniref:Uncharacterized protein n=1 Tax=Dreissena polymorpha TaxID=45954 RepID=A0A9D4GV65_DREPO|nr:hypothetical protein DPMN_126145 [Dreissena polymorpha]